jgi:hypothetical protein
MCLGGYGGAKYEDFTFTSGNLPAGLVFNVSKKTAELGEVAFRFQSLVCWRQFFRDVVPDGDSRVDQEGLSHNRSTVTMQGILRSLTMSTCRSMALIRFGKFCCNFAALVGLAAFLLAMHGCAAVQVKMGMKVYLAKTPVASIEASLPKGPGIGPGQKSPLVVTLTQPDGKVLKSEGTGEGKVLWEDLKVESTVVAVSKKGIVSLPEDPRVSDGKLPHLIITVPSHTDLHAELDIPLRYDYKFSAAYSGSRGSDGLSGNSGLDGSSGSSGSMDPNHPSAGGNGTDGGRGSDGSDGSRGGDGPPLQLRVALRSGSHPLLQVSLLAEGKTKLYLVDPQGGSLTVSSEGGSGGSGGKGGRGGRGGSGGIGSPNGSNGSDGSNGRDGMDGSQGSGGKITVTYDPQVKPYLTAIHLSNSGGPKLVFHEEPVDPLW